MIEGDLLKYVFIFFLVLLFTGIPVSAASMDSNETKISSWNYWNSTLKASSTSHSYFSKVNTACSSVIVNVNSTDAVFAYRRDSTYPATLYIQKTRWFGRETVKEYKTTNGYFFHTIISEGGWMIGTGGPDIVWINRALERIGGEIVVKGNVTSYDMRRAYSLVKRLGLGHFVIRGPDGQAGVAIYRNGYSKLSTFHLKPGEYITVPNSPWYYRRGYYSKWNTNPVRAAVYIAGTDRYGYNRRNILIYGTSRGENSTSVRVHVTFDGGRLIGRYWGRPDNVVFMGNYIKASSIPVIPSTKFLGALNLSRVT